MTTPTTAADLLMRVLQHARNVKNQPLIHAKVAAEYIADVQAEARAEADAQIAALRVALADEVAGYRGSTARSRRVLTDTAPAASWADERAAPPEDIRNLPFDGDAAPAEEARDG